MATKNKRTPQTATPSSESPAEPESVRSSLALAEVIQATQAALWEWDLVTGQVYYSPEWLAQIGRGNDPLPPQLAAWEARLHPDDRQPVMAALQAFRLHPSERLELEFQLCHQDGTYRWMRSRGRLIRDAAGQPARLLGCQLDLTERKSLEEQFRHAQRMESVCRLAGAVAHDYNNLLTIILGYSDLLLAGRTLDKRTREALKEIKKAGERASTLTSQLLAFSRRQILTPSELDLNQLIADCKKIVQRLVGVEVEVALRLAADLPLIKVDPGHLEQVLMNLVINAKDAMPGGGKLMMETEALQVDEHNAGDFPDLKPGAYVLLTVTDTGVGMDDITRSRMFEPFFTTKDLRRGTGLGLTMVFGFIKQSGGHIAVTSEPGHGSKFTIFLPALARADAVPPTARLAPQLPDGSETILLMEDEEGVRLLARQVLQNCGFKVLAPARGEEALALAQKHPGKIHLLITGVVMPGLGGKQLAEAVTQARPEIKVLYLSGHLDDTAQRQGIDPNDTTFLHKPFSIEALPAKVRRLLDL